MFTELSSHWDSQYAAEEWSYLWSEEQRPRYALIASLCHTSVRQPYRLLDVGCGEGVLLHYLVRDELERYVGLDWSEVAVRRAAERYRDLPLADFSAAAAEEYVSRCDERFEVVVINEVLYCCPDPLEVFKAYSRLVRDGGVLILSICDAQLALWQLIERVHHRWLKGSWHVGERRSGKGWGISLFSPNFS